MRNSGIIFWLLIPAMLGTTFIIKEGGVEVGRYSEEDGSDRIEVVEDDAPASAAKNQDIAAGDQAVVSAEESSEAKAAWTMMGTVLDVVRLKSMTSGTVVFSNGSVHVEAPIQWNGSFSMKVPKLEGGGGYLVSAILPGGKRAKVFLGETGAFRSMPYAQRLGLGNMTQQQSPLKGHKTDLEIGIYPEKLTKKEMEDYKIVMRQKS
jgi:hypothetical protein